MATNIWTSTASTVYSTGANWSLTTAPVNSDDVVFTNSAIAVASGLDQHLVTLNTFRQDANYTGLIGTATGYLVVGATTFNLGVPVVGSGIGSRRINLQCYNSGANVNVFNTATTANDASFTPVRLLTTAANLNVMGGQVGVALFPGETSSIAALQMTSGVSAPQVILGAGNTLTAGTIAAGSLVSYSANTTGAMTLNGSSSLVNYGTGAFTVLTIGSSSSCVYVGSGTITQLNLRGTLDLSQGTSTVVITNATLYSGAKIIDPLKRASYTNGIILSQCRNTDVSVDSGYNRTMSFV